MMRRLVAIVGPTGSGKSAIAMECAERLGGEIVNADSRQVYRRMDIGTAKPSAADRARVPHHLYDVAEPDADYSLALYQRQARAVLDDIWGRDSFAWLVGGTGQYVWAMLEDWKVPEVAPLPAFRREMEEFATHWGPATLHARLEAVDPVAASRIDARNVRRVVRALEVYQATGTPISSWQAKGTPDFEFLLFGIRADPEVLRKTIDARVDAMFEAGFVAEVQALLDAGVPPEAPAMSSIGYREVARALAGEYPEEAAKEETKRATWRFARRQGQWFRADDPRITWVEDAESIDMQANIFTGACTNVVRRSSRP